VFEVCVRQTFSAAHLLRGYAGKCARTHGHNYTVEVTLQSSKLNEIGLVVDFVEVKQRMKEVIERLDHFHLNDIPPFDTVNPSAENLALFFHDQLTGAWPEGVRLAMVRIFETETARAAYRPE